MLVVCALQSILSNSGKSLAQELTEEYMRLVCLLCVLQTTTQLGPGPESLLPGVLAALSVFHFIFSCVNKVEAVLFIELHHLFSFACFSLLSGILS